MPLHAIAPILAAFLSAGASLSTPPAFERVPEGDPGAGQARDGQRVVQPASPKRQVVAIVPDRTTGRDWGLRYLREAVADINREMPDAVFCVGDLVQGYSRSNEHVAGERKDFLDTVGALRMPFYPTPGNHDLVSGKRDGKDRSFADSYRALFGPLYYAVELELASFVVLNTEDGGGNIEPGFSDGQLSWLERTLGELNARGKPIIILFHRPLWDHKPTRWDERVQPMLVKHGVDYVIAGHYHSLQALPPRDGIPFLLLGTCGGAIDQHPLAGQLQHLTFVVIGEDGSIAPYHQVAGCTLPVDWMTKEDQDLAYRFKTSRDTVTLRGAVADPLRAATEGEIEITLRNPLDRPVEFTLRPARAPEPWTVTEPAPGEPSGEITRVWTSRTAFDLFNPHTTDLKSPFELVFDASVVTLAAGESRKVTLTARAAAQVLPCEPPPFEIVASFADGKGRKVPVLLRQRVPLARTIAVADTLADATPYSIAVWNWSEYDTAERNSTARVSAGRDGAELTVQLEMPDLVLSADAKPNDRKSGIEDPLGDAVRLVLGEGPEAREYLVTIGADGAELRVRTLTPDRERLEPSKAVAATLSAGSKGWTLTLQVMREALPANTAIDGMSLNIGVADNDETYHTQWRWLAPRQSPARLVRPSP
jgi:hypothetical protein